MVVFGALQEKNKYPAICSNYDDLQESGNTQAHPHVDGGALTGTGHDFQGFFFFLLSWGRQGGGWLFGGGTN